jgi:type IV secretion system protein TrbG
MKRPNLITVSLAALALAMPAQADKKPRADVGEANQSAIRGAADASLVGALHEFAYERGALYAIQASPSRITDIALEAGEQLLSVSAGDTTRWIVGDAKSGTSATLQAHVLVKPNAAALATNLVIMTDRRVYHVELKSVSGPAMAAVSWRYPAEMMLQNNPQPIAASATAPEQPIFKPETLNLRYKISGDKPDWRPVAVFDDGQQVFIEMPPVIAKIDAPPLFVSGPDGAEMVNYRVRGNFYIVDRLFRQAELKLGTGWNTKTVRIERTSPIGGSNG